MLDDLKGRGVKLGRPLRLTPQQIGQARKLVAQGERPEEVAASFHVERPTLYRAIELPAPAAKRR
jgi:DNA invertase Pin-like site-specific DNA recombinase